MRQGIARGRRRAWLAGVVLLITAAVIVVIVQPSAAPVTAGPAVVFGTLPPGADLPSGAQCARWVRASPRPEITPANQTSNDTVGQPVGPHIFPAGDSPQVKNLAFRIDGDFTGTTQEILRWAACKWGISQDIVFAQAAVESWWQQRNLGDWATDASLCPPGHGLGADGRPGECPQSYGIVQDKYRFVKAAWPALNASTAMNVDVAYAIWRSCYDGYEIWLGDGPAGRPYHAGDVWGCVGRWYAGSWYTPGADEYIAAVKNLMNARIWTQSGFARG